MKIYFLAFLIFVVLGCGFGQSDTAHTYKLALPSHKGQLQLQADGFQIVQMSAKSGGREIGIRGKDESSDLSFLAFLFLFPERSPMLSASCRDGVIEPEKRSDRTLKIVASSEIPRSDGPAVDVVSYTSQLPNGKTVYRVRGFVASGDVCGDLEFYDEDPITAEDPKLAKILAGYRLDANYAPKFQDQFLYAQTLYEAHMYQAAAPIFEEALASLDQEHVENIETMRRVTTDQAGMSYGISGNIPKARTIFEKAIAQDPDYPLYYYNLACADAEENKLNDARTHLQEAFARKENVLRGESMPDPSKDDSFLPHQNNKDFWKFVESLR
jgi:hypothetical protein